MIPFAPIIMWALTGVAVVGVLSAVAESIASEIDTDNLERAEEALKKATKFNPESLDELYRNRHNLNPLVRENLERFLKNRK
jgi:hypothetical protein